MGQLSMQGIAPVSSRLDHLGFFAQHPTSIEYLAECLGCERHATIGSMMIDESRPTSAAYSYSKLDISSQESILASSLRLTIVRPFISNENELSTIERTVEGIRSNTDQTVEVRYEEFPFDLDEALEAHRCIMCYDLAKVHAGSWGSSRDRYPDGIASLIEEGLNTSDEIYEKAIAMQTLCARMLDVWLSNGRVLVSLASMGPAPQSLKTTGDPRYNSIYSLAGLPVVTCPIHVDADGMPIGIQLAAHPSLEKLLFDVAGILKHEVVSATERGYR